MVLGPAPMAFLGAHLLHLMGHATASQANIEEALGATLLVGAATLDPNVAFRHVREQPMRLTAAITKMPEVPMPEE
jgi:hypothetical protein